MPPDAVHAMSKSTPVDDEEAAADRLDGSEGGIGGAMRRLSLDDKPGIHNPSRASKFPQFPLAPEGGEGGVRGSGAGALTPALERGCPNAQQEGG